MRIIYILEPYHFPGGGIATIYRHVEILNAHGFTAFVGLSTKPATDFYQTTAPLLIHAGRLKVQSNDIFVIPEIYPHVFKALMNTPAKRLMFCQNHYDLPFTSDSRASIGEFGAHGVIVNSRASSDFFKDVYGITDLPLLPQAIDAGLFAPAARKTRQIAFMPRKLPRDAAFIEAVFKRRHPQYAAVPWVRIDGVTQREVARLMAESECFLSLSHKDSCPYPPLEAMACGCLVAGFHGDGGREYMTPENGWWADTGDYMACADGLAAALTTIDAGGPALNARLQAMAATVQRYSPAQRDTTLLAFWHKQLAELDLPEQPGQTVSVALPSTTASPWWKDWMPPILVRAASRLKRGR